MFDDVLLYISIVPWLGYLITGFFGLVIGSFLTFLVYRIKTGEPWLWGRVATRSKCPACGHVLGVLDLIPVLSWVASRGRCRYCGTKISVKYPLIEVVTAFVFMGAYYLYSLEQ